MAQHLKRLSPEWLERHEARLELTRRKFQRQYAKERAAMGYSGSYSLTAHDIAHAIRIAMRSAKTEGCSNPRFFEALDIAAELFDQLDLRGCVSTTEEKQK